MTNSISSKITSSAIHGNKSQGARTKALAGFKKGDIRVLVATDIAARGLDIPLLPFVVNYELPNVPEDYVHRIGRTGRAGAGGEAISLVSVAELEHVRGIEKLIGERFDLKEIEGFEPSERPEEHKPVPTRKGQQRKKTGSKTRQSFLRQEEKTNHTINEVGSAISIVEVSKGAMMF